MKYFKADIIFPVTSKPVYNGFVLTDDDGTIIKVANEEIIDAPCDLTPVLLNGMLLPGFINTHCHLELSYLKGLIPPGNGLESFISALVAIRKNVQQHEILKAIKNAEHELYDNGIVAIADICNDNYTFSIKAGSKLYFHTLIEAFDLVKEQTESTFNRFIQLREELKKIAPANSSSSIVPHAPYSVTHGLFKRIADNFTGSNSLQSIHNQECAAEADLFISGTGKLYEFFKSFGSAMEQFKPTGKNSIHSYLPFMNKDCNTLLVHNTYTTLEDIAWAEEVHKKLFWCFCPNANLYIENRLPQFENFIEAGVRCCLGTDSYASNYNLSILDEIKTIAKHNPSIPAKTLIEWATLNGAKYMGIEKKYGSIEPGKQPGLILIENADAENIEFSAGSSLLKII